MDYKKFLPLIGIILLLYILATMDLSGIAQIFLSLNPLFVFASLFTIFPVLLLVNVQWQLLLKKQHINVRFFSSFKNIFIGFFYGFITPAGIGSYLRAIYLKKESNAPIPKCVSNIVTLSTIDILTLLLWGAIATLFVSRRYPYLLIAIILIFCFFLFLLVFFLRKRTSYFLFSRIIKTRVFQVLQKTIDDPLESFYEDLPRFRDLLLPAILSFCGWFFFYAEFYVISRFFSVDVPFWSVIFIYAIANVIATIPISIYGLGTREATLLSLFSLYPVLPVTVVSLSLYWFVITMLLASIIGAIITLLEHKKEKTHRLNTAVS